MSTLEQQGDINIFGEFNHTLRWYTPLDDDGNITLCDLGDTLVACARRRTVFVGDSCMLSAITAQVSLDYDVMPCAVFDDRKHFSRPASANFSLRSPWTLHNITGKQPLLGAPSMFTAYLGLVVQPRHRTGAPQYQGPLSLFDQVDCMLIAKSYARATEVVDKLQRLDASTVQTLTSMGLLPSDLSFTASRSFSDSDYRDVQQQIQTYLTRLHINLASDGFFCLPSDQKADQRSSTQQQCPTHGPYAAYHTVFHKHTVNSRTFALILGVLRSACTRCQEQASTGVTFFTAPFLVDAAVGNTSRH